MWNTSSSRRKRRRRRRRRNRRRRRGEGEEVRPADSSVCVLSISVVWNWKLIKSRRCVSMIGPSHTATQPQAPLLCAAERGDFCWQGYSSNNARQFLNFSTLHIRYKLICLWIIWHPRNCLYRTWQKSTIHPGKSLAYDMVTGISNCGGKGSANTGEVGESN